MFQYDVSGIGRNSFFGGDITTQLPFTGQFGQIPYNYFGTIPFGQNFVNPISNPVMQGCYPTTIGQQYHPMFNNWIHRNPQMMGQYPNVPYGNSQLVPFYTTFTHPFLSQNTVSNPWQNYGLGITPWNISNVCRF